MSLAERDWSPLPHVTDILKPVQEDMSFVPPEALARGTAVHEAVYLLVTGRLDRFELHPQVRARLRQFERFVSESGCTPRESELRVTNDVLGYCGTLDLEVELDGDPGILDLKGPMVCRSHGPQLAAYAGTYKDRLAFRRWNLYLTDDDYRLVERTSRDDWKVFLACLTVHNFKETAK